MGQRRTGDAIEQKHKTLAHSAQAACEKAMLALLRRVAGLSGSRNLCLAGGVALNCKANGELARSGLIDDIYIQPAAGDEPTRHNTAGHKRCRNKALRDSGYRLIYPEYKSGYRALLV